MCQSNTAWGNPETQTVDVVAGDRVRVVAQTLELEGVVVGSLSSGRLSIRIARGLFLEIARYCVEKLENAGE